VEIIKYLGAVWVIERRHYATSPSRDAIRALIQASISDATNVTRFSPRITALGKSSADRWRLIAVRLSDVRAHTSFILMSFGWSICHSVFVERGGNLQNSVLGVLLWKRVFVCQF
jgi:hypothetical protein